MDSYAQFHVILSKWIGSVGSFMGIDVLRKDFKISGHTIFVIIITLLLPTLYGWTIYAFEGDLQMKAIGYIGIGFQVKLLYLYSIKTSWA